MSDDGKVRCAWCLSDPLYVDYHDKEWGVKVVDAEKLFEMLSLEMMQAGLSWITILRKRETMREAFFGFKPSRLARAKEKEVDKWLNNKGVIRHRGKLEALVNNAKHFELEENFSEFLWSFKPLKEHKKH